MNAPPAAPSLHPSTTAVTASAINHTPVPPALPPRLPATPQILMWATAALKGTKAAHYRGCSKDDMLGLLASDERRLYLTLHNIDGPGAA